VDVFASAALKQKRLAPLLRYLVKQHGATNVLVEGGATLLGTLADQKLIDEARLFIAPKLAGDAAALQAVRGTRAVQKMKAATPLQLRQTQRIGDDMLLYYDFI